MKIREYFTIYFTYFKGCIGDSMAALGFLEGVGLLGGANRENAGKGNNSNTICFFGHSLGALIAFETTRYLKTRYALDVPYLYISCLPEPFTICDANRDHFVTKRSELNDDLLLKKMKEMGDSVLDELCVSEDIRNGNEGSDNLKNLLEMFIPLLRADFALLENYVIDTYQQKDDSSTAVGSRSGLRQCHLTTLACEGDSVVIGDEYRGDNTNERKMMAKGIQSKFKADDKGKKINEPKKISRDYIDTIEEWSQQLAGGLRGAPYSEGCESFHINLPSGSHHNCLLHPENIMILVSDVVQKMKYNQTRREISEKVL